jgi:hypothetical protein
MSAISEALPGKLDETPETGPVMKRQINRSQVQYALKQGTSKRRKLEQ